MDLPGISPERDNEDAARGFQLTACGPGIPSLPHESNKLSGTIDQPTPIDGVPPTSRRTVAGFQGRIGKPLDACYLFWYTAGLTIMSRQGFTQGLNPSTSHHNPSPADHCLQTNVEDQSLPLFLYKPHANIQFLLRCQSSQWGGIAQSPGNHPGECFPSPPFFCVEEQILLEKSMNSPQRNVDFHIPLKGNVEIHSIGRFMSCLFGLLLIPLLADLAKSAISLIMPT
ncbi:hypothetical protein PSTT_05083 [Puccinia striiformis]|uniref:Prenyltransferase alpha-alpha toroid domain-containing protein n=1 Tax=Puccinia striiformis TaxID=27350 RepID=A0A2S4VQI8_9BASI|nr:hypothetical protein PSTT_05083 [Puccinia striiformis]